MIYRHLSKKILTLALQFPVLGVLGPRQSGKTTLVKQLFKHLPYISLEDIDQRIAVINDPRWFINKYREGVVIDEVQHAPELLSYLQTHVDNNPDQSGKFVVTGSQNLLLSEKISQTLAGRIALFTLLPFSLEELKDYEYVQQSTNKLIFQGLYPRIINSSIEANDWYPNYISTYVERDVRQIKNITDLNRFQIFLKLCAGRTGQLLNLSALANDCSISHVTARQWLSILEASYLIYIMPPHFKNFNKRLVKSPKLYFYDTGLACCLLGIEKYEQLDSHYLKGALFENMVINELLKYRFNEGKSPNLYFWRDKMGHEIDCIMDIGGELVAIEIKSGQTLSDNFFKNITYLKNLSGLQKSLLIYDGLLEIQKVDTSVINVRNFISTLKEMYLSI